MSEEILELVPMIRINTYPPLFKAPLAAEIAAAGGAFFAQRY